MGKVALSAEEVIAEFRRDFRPIQLSCIDETSTVCLALHMLKSSCITDKYTGVTGRQPGAQANGRVLSTWLAPSVPVGNIARVLSENEVTVKDWADAACSPLSRASIEVAANILSICDCESTDE